VIWTLAKKELRGYFNSAVALIFLGAFLVGTLYTFFWYEKFFARGIAELRPLFEAMPLLLAILVSALSMRLWAEERNTGTLEVLLTLPVPRWKLVAGKFVGGMLLIAIALALTLGIPLTVSSMGNLDWGPVIGGYLAALLLSAAYLVIGMCISAATGNQIVAFVGTALSLAILAGVGKLGGIAKLFSTSSRFESVARGVLDLRDLAFYAGIVALGFAINVLLLSSVSWGNAKLARARRTQLTISVGLIAANAILLVIWLAPVRAARVDLTQDGVYSLSHTTRDLVSGLEQPLLIRGYFSESTHPDLEPLIPQIRDLLDEYRSAGNGKVKVEVVDPGEDLEVKREAKERFEIEPVPISFETANQTSVVNAYFQIAIEYGDQHVVIQTMDLLQIRQSDLGKVDIKLGNNEYEITKSIRKAVQSFSSIDSLFASTPGKVKMDVYLTPDALPQALAQAPAMIDKVTKELIKESNNKLEVQTISPKTEAEMIELYKKFGLQPAPNLENGKLYYLQVLVEIAGRYVRISLPENLSEASIKSTLLDGLKRGAPGFTRVVGMWVPKGAGGGIDPMTGQPGRPQPPPQSFEKLRAELSGDYEVRDVTLASEVPSDIEVLLLAGPANLDDKAAGFVEKFVGRGGSLVVLDGRFRLAPSPTGLAIEKVATGLEKLFESWGITVDDKLVLDTKNDVFPMPRMRDVGGGTMIQEIEQVPYPFFVKVTGGQLSSSIVTRSVPGAVMHFSSPVTVKEKPDRVKVDELMTSSDESWLSTSLTVEPGEGGFQPTGEQAGRQLAAAITFVQPESADKAALSDKLPAEARIVVFGSSVFVTDALLNHAQQFRQGLALSNVTLVHSAIDWAFADTDLLGIRAASAGAHALTIGPESRAQWQVINVIIAIVLLGIAIAIPVMRRKRVLPVVTKRAS
jgi:ABC-2 type transport system permease protein